MTDQSCASSARRSPSVGSEMDLAEILDPLTDAERAAVELHAAGCSRSRGLHRKADRISPSCVIVVIHLLRTGAVFLLEPPAQKSRDEDGEDRGPDTNEHVPQQDWPLFRMDQRMTSSTMARQVHQAQTYNLGWPTVNRLAIIDPKVLVPDRCGCLSEDGRRVPEWRDS